MFIAVLLVLCIAGSVVIDAVFKALGLPFWLQLIVAFMYGFFLVGRAARWLTS